MKKNIIMAKEKEKENRQRKVTVDIKIENLPSHAKRSGRILKTKKLLFKSFNGILVQFLEQLS